MKIKGLVALFSGLVACCCAVHASEDSRRDATVVAIEKTLSSIVNINTEEILRRYSDPFEELFYEFYGAAPKSYSRQYLGSGVIIDEAGYVVTNEHVVRRATKISVTTMDAKTYEADVVSSDEYNDLALLKLKNPPDSLVYMALASPDDLYLGETVIALGNPYGYGHSVTRGILSAKNRSFVDEAGRRRFDDLLQTDASINPGNSGGALINLNGQLIGINTAILANAQGIGFAIPVKRVELLLREWLTLERRKEVLFGARFRQENQKILVDHVNAGTPAESAGLRANDEILAADEREFNRAIELERYLLRKDAGQTVVFSYRRDKDVRMAKVKLVSAPKVTLEELLRRKLGVTLQPMNEELAEAFGYSSISGAMISGVEPGSAAEEAGLRRGYVVDAIGSIEPQNANKLKDFLLDLKPGSPVRVDVRATQRRGHFIYQQSVSIELKAQ